MIADFVGGIFDVVAEVTTGLGTTLTAVFGMVYGGEPAALTPLGMVLIIIVGAPMAWDCSIMLSVCSGQSVHLAVRNANSKKGGVVPPFNF